MQCISGRFSHETQNTSESGMGGIEPDSGSGSVERSIQKYERASGRIDNSTEQIMLTSKLKSDSRNVEPGRVRRVEEDGERRDPTVAGNDLAGNPGSKKRTVDSCPLVCDKNGDQIGNRDGPGSKIGRPRTDRPRKNADGMCESGGRSEKSTVERRELVTDGRNQLLERNDETHPSDDESEPLEYPGQNLKASRACLGKSMIHQLAKKIRDKKEKPSRKEIRKALSRVRKKEVVPEGKEKQGQITMLLTNPGVQPKAMLSLRLDNGTEKRWIRVDREWAVEQVLKYIDDTAARKVHLRGRNMDIRKAELQDGDLVQIIGKWLGEAEKMVGIMLKLYEKESQRAAVPEKSDQVTIQTYIQAIYGMDVPLEDIPIAGERILHQESC
jgi:hypothetical protein